MHSATKLNTNNDTREYLTINTHENMRKPFDLKNMQEKPKQTVDAQEVSV